jgi:hypothetical protein
MSVTINHQTNHITATNGSVTTDGRTGSNLIINGAMQVWQRGTSVTGAGTTGYSTADRWQHNASGGSLDLSQQSLTLGQTDIPQQIKHFMRVACTTGNNNAGMWQKVEDVTSAQGTVTVSFYAKGTNPNGGSFELNIRQNYGSSGSTEDEQNETFSVTSSWQRFTFTFSLTSLSGKTVAGGDDYIWVYFRQPSADTSTNAWTLDFTGVQLEVGDTATPFEHRSYGDELARCQRYYYKFPSASRIGVAQCYATNGSCVYSGLYPATMRAIPTILRTGTIEAYNASFTAVYAIATANTLGVSADNFAIAFVATSSGHGVGNATTINTAAGTMAADAEL